MCRELVQIEIPRRSGDRFLGHLAKRLVESARQRSAARFLLVDRLLEDHFSPRGLLSENLLRVAQLRFVRAFRLIVSDDSFEIDIDDQQRVAARTDNVEFRFELGHASPQFPDPSPRASPCERLAPSS